MGDERTHMRCQQAIAELKACYERQREVYGQEGITALERLENEGPAPSPCLDHYNATVEALLEHGGSLEEFELGEFRKPLEASLTQRQ